MTLDQVLLEVAQVRGLTQAKDSEIQFLREWLIDKKMGKGEIEGRQGRVWYEKDLVVLKGKEGERAPFSAWVSGSILRLFDRFWGFKHKGSSSKTYLPFDCLLTYRRAGPKRLMRRQGSSFTKKRS